MIELTALVTAKSELLVEVTIRDDRFQMASFCLEPDGDSWKMSSNPNTLLSIRRELKPSVKEEIIQYLYNTRDKFYDWILPKLD